MISGLNHTILFLWYTVSIDNGKMFSNVFILSYASIYRIDPKSYNYLLINKTITEIIGRTTLSHA
jgi:hypothetical protein